MQMVSEQIVYFGTKQSDPGVKALQVPLLRKVLNAGNFQKTPLVLEEMGVLLNGGEGVASAEMCLLNLGVSPESSPK